MRRKRQALTLIEMMLVIILVGIVGGALAFNLKGAVQKGKLFKTEETKRKIDSILNLAQLEGHSLEEIKNHWLDYAKASPLLKTSKDQKQILDGWGQPFNVKIDENTDTIAAFSPHIDYEEKNDF